MMEIKSLFSVFIKRAVLMRKIGKMGRPPKILGETTGRLTDATADKLSKRKNLSLHQRKEILQIIKKPENKDLGYKSLSDLVHAKLGIKVSKTTIKRIKTDKNFVFKVKTSVKTTRTHEISPMYNSFRNQLFDIIHAESSRVCISNAMIAKYAKFLQSQAIYSDEKIQKLNFSNNWIWQYKKDFNITYRRIVGKKFLVNDTAVEESLAELSEMRQYFDLENLYNFDESAFNPWAKSPYANFASDFDPARMFRDNEKLAFSTGSFISASGNVDFPIFIAKSCPRNLFANENTQITNFEYRTRTGVLKKESARTFHVDIGGTKKPVIFMKSERGFMTANLFKFLLKTADKKFREEDRQVLLLLDNAPSHANLQLDLTNIKLFFFPPNATSVMQPCGRILRIKLLIIFFKI
jgi:hypothetical protein